jgi:hypothetical protein
VQWNAIVTLHWAGSRHQEPAVPGWYSGALVIRLTVLQSLLGHRGSATCGAYGDWACLEVCGWVGGKSLGNIPAMLAPCQVDKLRVLPDGSATCGNHLGLLALGVHMGLHLCGCCTGSGVWCVVGMAAREAADLLVQLLQRNVALAAVQLLQFACAGHSSLRLCLFYLSGDGWSHCMGCYAAVCTCDRQSGKCTCTAVWGL